MSENKFKIIERSIFRRTNPAVFGIEVLSGTVRQNDRVLNARGEYIGIITQMMTVNNSLMVGEATKLTGKVVVVLEGLRGEIEEDIYTTLPS